MRVNQFPIFLRRAVAAAAGGGATLVQTSGAKAIVNQAAGTYTFTMPGNITAGNTVIIAATVFRDDNTMPAGCMVVAGTTCILDSVKQSVSNAGYFVCIFRATNVTGGTPNLVYTTVAGTNYVTLSMEEWSNFNATPVDSVPTPVQVTSTSTGITSGTIAQANELVYAITNTNGSGTGFAGPSNGFTQTVLDTGGTNLPVAAGYKKVSAIAAYLATFAITASVELNTVMVTYKTP